MAVDYRTNPGVFDKTVILIAEHLEQDESGALVSVWHPFAKVPAAVEPMAGREYWNAVQTQSESQVRVTIRYRKNVPSRLRVKYDTPDGQVILELKSPPINYNERNEYLELVCRRYQKESPGLDSGDTPGDGDVIFGG